MTYPYLTHYIRQKNQGSAIARNTGVKNARGNLLVFTDDDIWLNSEYVIGLFEDHQKFDRIIGMGTFLPFFPENPTLFAQIYADNNRGAYEQSGEFVDFTACVTNNLSVRKEDFYKIGAMQDVAGDGPTWWRDVDFGYRAHQLGFRFRRSGEAHCIHCDYSSVDLQSVCKRAEKVSFMVHALNKKYLGIQNYLPMFTDKRPVKWGLDQPRLIARKLVRKVSSSGPALSSLELITRLIESRYPNPRLLHPLYRWVIGAYIYRGYRQGLKEYGNLDNLS